MIGVKGVRVAYDNRAILKLGEMSFKAGSISTILGKNGSGKSTFLRTMAGLLHYNGTIEIYGDELRNIPFMEKAKIAGYIPQSPLQADMTVRLLIAHGRFPWKHFPRRLNDDDASIIDAAIERVGIGHIAHKNLKEISGGELKLSYLAMLLAQKTKVLLLDEADAHLDMEHQELLYKILREEAAAGKIVIMTTHDLVKSLNFSDMIHVLCNGENILDGTPPEIANRGDKLLSVMGVSVIESAQKDSLYRYIYRKWQ